ncbi:MAG: calcium-binding protein [Microcoleaceae cyanobacterium]
MVVFNGTPGNDSFVGTPGNDTLSGGTGGNDTLNGVGGNDRISGNQGLDRLLGGSGSDALFGGQGSDGLFGGMGNDLMFGDRDLDFLAGDAGLDTVIGGSGPDVFFQINGDNTDFNAAEGDQEVHNTAGFSAGNSIGAETTLSNTAKESPSIVELKREGDDLVITISGETDYFNRRQGAAESINDPYAVLNSIAFVDDDTYSSLLEIGDSVPSEFENQPVSDSLVSTPGSDFSSDIAGAEAFLTQYIEELEASGADEGLIDDVKESLSNVQEYIEDELTRQQEPADLSLLPEQVFLIEEGTTIPTEFQAEMAGSEVLPLPEGFFEEFFTPIDLESMFPGLL